MYSLKGMVQFTNSFNNSSDILRVRISPIKMFSDLLLDSIAATILSMIMEHSLARFFSTFTDCYDAVNKFFRMEFFVCHVLEFGMID